MKIIFPTSPEMKASPISEKFDFIIYVGATDASLWYKGVRGGTSGGGARRRQAAVPSPPSTTSGGGTAVDARALPAQVMRCDCAGNSSTSNLILIELCHPLPLPMSTK